MRIPSFKQIKSLFRDQPRGSERGYREVTALGGANSDWPVNMLGEDSDLWQNAWMLTSRVRDLFRTNPLYQKYREILWANIFGEAGIMLRSKIKEQEDRTVYAPDEKAALLSHEHRINRIREWASCRCNRSIPYYRAMKLADFLETSERSLENVLRAKASVQVGDPDVYANQLFENAWLEWQRAEYSDIRGTRDYKVHRQLRLISAVRDGDCFIRMIRDPRANDFGFTLQLINAEWCDRFFNSTLTNGNEVRMGIEYTRNIWGIGKPVAYYFIKRQPNDWQFSIPGAFNFSSGDIHTRVPADEIIHYARAVDADGTRPAPWVASTIPKARQLDQYELAEVVAAREAACKTGFFWSDTVAEGGEGVGVIDPRTGVPTFRSDPGGYYGLPYGVKFQPNDPTHPNGNFETFRQGMVRTIGSGMPGSSYSEMANDYAAINFSAGRLQRLDSNEMFKLLQRNDIDVAENKIYEAWQEMAIITGTIALPLAKLKKYRSKVFQGRRWGGVDEIKEVNASALRIANKLSSRHRECANGGIDFDTEIIELAEEEMALEELGLSTITTSETPLAPKPQEDVTDPQDEQQAPQQPDDSDEHDSTIKLFALKGGPGSGPQTHEGRKPYVAHPKSGVELAKEKYVPFGAQQQRYAEEHNEPEVAKKLGGLSFKDNEPVDIVMGEDGVIKHGIELKTVIRNNNGKITMSGEALARKRTWARKNKAQFHTVVVDDSKVFNAGGEGVHDETQRVLYYRRGAGSFRIAKMYKCKDMDEVKTMINTPTKKLPKGAK